MHRTRNGAKGVAVDSAVDTPRWSGTWQPFRLVAGISLIEKTRMDSHDALKHMLNYAWRLHDDMAMTLALLILFQVSSGLLLGVEFRWHQVELRPEVAIRSRDAPDFASGVGFQEWLRHITIEVPKPEPFDPLKLSGGNCSEIEIQRLRAKDLTSGLAPAFALQIAAHLRCTLLLGDLAISFAIQNATVELSFLVQPVAPENSKLLVPLGKLEVTSCSISIVMSMLHFTGSMLQGPLQELESGLERFINDQLPGPTKLIIH